MLLALEDSGRSVERMLAAEAAMLVLAAAQAVGVDRGIVVAEVVIQQADVQMLADAGTLAVEQGAGDCGQRVNPGAGVAHRQARDHWGLARLADRVYHARVAGADKIPSRLIGQRTVLPEGRDRAHHNLRIERLDHLIAQPAALHRAGPEVFYHHVHAANQLLYNSESRFFLNVDAQALFAQVLLDEIAAAVVLEVRHPAGLIAAGRHLDLDYLGAHLGHHAGHGRPGDVLAEVQHLVAAKDVLVWMLDHSNFSDAIGNSAA